MSLWWPQMELKNYFTTVDKIITSGQISEFEVSKQLYQSPLHDYLQMAPLTFWQPKLGLKILPHFAQSIDSELMDRF